MLQFLAVVDGLHVLLQDVGVLLGKVQGRFMQLSETEGKISGSEIIQSQTLSSSLFVRCL